ncbi:MAG: hypothetical protein ACI9OJ_004931 [Myxococcota bacterium]|jgi:hypothetical protein
MRYPLQDLTRTRARVVRGGVMLALALSAVITTAGSVDAQDRDGADPTVVLVGKVVDAETGQPLHGAFVSEGGDAGYLTHKDGSFSLPVWPYGFYTLTVELLGYETLEIEVPGPETDPFVISVSPDPIQLEGLTVLMDRFERRRRHVPVAVRAFDRDELLNAPIGDVVDWVAGRYGLVTSFCGNTGRRTATQASLRSGAFMDEGQECVMRRGRWVRPAIYIDDVRALGGLDELRTYRPQDLYTIEIYDRGAAVYAYTPWFVERVLKGRRFITPLVFSP